MSNKRIIKKVFDNEFDIEKMRNKIILKGEKNKYINQFFKFSIPMCLIFIICFTVILNSNLVFKNKSSDKENKLNDIININKINVIEITEADIDGNAEDIELEEVYDFYSKIRSIVIPIDLNNVRNIKMFSRENPTSDYTIFDGFNIMYSNGDINTENIEIFMSKTLKEKRRCISIINDSYKTSFINETEITIISFNDKFIVTFKYNDIYFDIETNNVSQNELILLLKSIIV